MECIDHALDLNDGSDVGLPLRPGDGSRCVKYDNGSGFVAIASFRIDRLDAGQGLGGGAGGLYLLTQGLLVVLELNNQMRGCRRRGFKGFLRNCWFDLVQSEAESLCPALKIVEHAVPVARLVIGSAGIGIVHAVLHRIVKENRDLVRGRGDGLGFAGPRR